MRYVFWLFVFAVGSTLTAQAVVPPRSGGPLPQAYFDAVSLDPSAFRMTHGWIEKTRRAHDARNGLIASVGAGEDSSPAADTRVTGDFEFPVILGAFANRPAPYAKSELQNELFDGPWPTGTLAEYFDEVSYGLLKAGGMVTNWVVTMQQDFYYEGASNGLMPNDARTGEFIKELLDATDVGVDFSAYDNDGPDGVPNSGDDDGYVDFIIFVHSESGGECDEMSPNMCSHSWLYRGWPISGGEAYVTNDPAATGGFIKIDDYSLQPAKSCGGGMVEIGSFCHEMLHALGVPDLFDPNGRSSGVGDWDLMGLGCWNLPSSPAHPSAWVKAELGWVAPTVVSWQGSVESIPQIETEPVCYKLPFTDDRFLRLSECSITGAYSLRCGLSTADAGARHWVGGSGYGNGWSESVERRFDFDGTTPVWFAFDYRYDLEPDADSAFVSIEVGGEETVLAGLTGGGLGSANIDLSPYLGTTPAPSSYIIRFRVKSDGAWSDEDGKHDTVCGALVVDNLTVTGGGLSYATGFETSADGWHQDPEGNPATEYWLVENRQPVGFDAHLHAPGLLIWHVDEEVVRSVLGNTGGTDGMTVHGLVLEEADGVGHLLQDPETTGNTGDDGDPWPGSAANTTFGAASVPSSNDNGNQPTNIEVSSIGASGPTMTAFLRAGDPGPTAAAVSPGVINNDLTTVSVEVDGSGFGCGASFRFEKTGEPDLVPSSVYWQDSRKLHGEFYVYSRRGGSWDLFIENPDGQQAVLEDAVTIVQIVAAQLVSAMIGMNGDDVELLFELYGTDDGETFVVSRAASQEGPWIVLDRPVEVVGENSYRVVDDAAEPGRMYYYKLDVRSADGTVRELYRGSLQTPNAAFVLEQNHPNPFNPNTTIGFHLPKRCEVKLEIFDVSGARVAVVAEGELPAGTHERIWDGRDARGSRVGSGVYVYRLTAGKRSQSRKMILLK